MGKYTFVWQHAASEVFVTGEFDDWQQTIKLENEDGIFKKTVELPSKKLQYKFVVDGNWCMNDSANKEVDGKGIFNNVLYPEDIKDEPIGTLSSAAPESSTAALAGAVPKETKKEQEDIPGAFPITPFETPAAEPQSFSINPIPATDGPGNPIKLAPGEPVPDPSTLTSNTIQSTVKDDVPEEETFGVAPIPATDGPGNPIKLAPGEPVPDPSTLTSNTIQSTVKDDVPEEETVSVAPIPATAGPGNPIHLAPGEKVPDPSTFTSNTVESTVKTDAESYEKSDAQPPQLAPVGVTPEAERDAKGGMFSLPPLTGGLIPESSLPKDFDAKSEQDPGVTIQSAAPSSTTAALAGAVPKEAPAVPETVTESQKEAGFAPEASANPVAVEEKKEVEQELKEKVPEEPATAEGTSTVQKIGAAALGGATIAAGTFAAATYAAKDKAAAALGLNGQATTTEVPAVVTESQKEAHVGPEASANPEAVVEKSAVEQELLSEVKKTTETGEHAPVIAAASTEVPEVVTESQKEAHASPEASANPEAVEEKKEVEQELLKEVKKATESGEPAPTVTAATSATAPALSDDALVESKPLKSSSEPNALEAVPEPLALTSVEPSTAKSAEPEVAKAVESETPKPKELEPTKPTVDSRDVSPMSKQPTTATQTQPVVTTGVETATTPAKSTAPATPKKTLPDAAKETPGSVASGATDKKSKRKSFMMKIKKVFN